MLGANAKLLNGRSRSGRCRSSSVTPDHLSAAGGCAELIPHCPPNCGFWRLVCWQPLSTKTDGARWRRMGVGHHPWVGLDASRPPPPRPRGPATPSGPQRPPIPRILRRWGLFRGRGSCPSRGLAPAAVAPRDPDIQAPFAYRSSGGHGSNAASSITQPMPPLHRPSGSPSTPSDRDALSLYPSNVHKPEVKPGKTHGISWLLLGKSPRMNWGRQDCRQRTQRWIESPALWPHAR